MPPIEITVTLDLQEWAKGIGWQSSDGEWNTEPYGPLENYVANGLIERIAHDLRPAITKEVIDAVKVQTAGQAADLIVQVLSGPIQMTDLYGTPKGQPKTIVELVTEEAGKALSARPPVRTGRERPTLIAEIVATEIDRAFRDELKPVLEEAKAKVKAAVQAKAAEMIANTVREMSR